MKRKCSVLSLLLTAVLAVCPAGIPASAAGYGQGTARDDQNRPSGAAAFQQQYADFGAYAFSDDSKRIILTFDQGYENGYTAKILDTLRDRSVTAIFFLTGDYAKKEQPLVRRMITEGHMLGNHGMKHLSAPSLSDGELEQELMCLHEYVREQYGYEMQYFRPPCGEYDERTLQTVQRLGYRTLFWSYAYVDWKTDAQPEPQKALEQLTGAAHGGAVYLLHSVSSTNAEVLGSLIDALREKGYTV